MNRAELSYSRSSFAVARPTIILAGALCALAAFFGQTRLAAALMFVFLFALVARLWAHLAARRVTVEVSAPECGLFPGDELCFGLTAKNDKFLPLIWLEVFAPVAANRCLLPADGREPDDWEFAGLQEQGAATDIVGEKRLPFLLWYETAEAQMRWRAEKRGLYSMESWRIRTGDGFGLAQLEWPLDEADRQTVAVYPRLVEVSPELFLRNLWNSENGARGVMADPTVIRSTRDYLPTDSVRRINWRLAARGLPLTVNVYEEILPKSAHFIFDGSSFFRTAPHFEELEDALSVLASLCVRLETLEVRCGLSLSGTGDAPPVSLFAGAGAGTEDLLRAMAAYEPPQLVYDREKEKYVCPPPRFDEAELLDAARQAGRFYWVTYDAPALREQHLPETLGRGAVTVLTYVEGEPFGDFETVCLTQLKEVKRHG